MRVVALLCFSGRLRGCGQLRKRFHSDREIKRCRLTGQNQKMERFILFTCRTEFLDLFGIVKPMETKPHYNVLIATPGRSFVAEYVESMVNTCAWLSSQNLTYKFLSKYSSFVPSARELTATDTYVHDWQTKEVGASKYTYDKIFWIDSDIEWSVDAFKRIYESDLDIISGLYQTNPYGKVAVHYPDDQGRPTQVNKVEFLLHEDPLEVGGVGFGFVAMKQGVFENMERPWFLIRRVQWDDSDYPVNVGEDYSWCAAAQNAGYKIWIDPLVKVNHHKEAVYVV